MVKQGYKQTEIGVIPEDWEVKELKEVVELRREKVNPLTSKEVFRCIELENILPNTGRIVGEIYTNEVVSLKTKFFKHDVLFGKLRPYLRKYGLPDFDGVCTSEIWVLYSKLISHNFLYYIIQTDKLIELANQSTGTKMPRAEWSIVSSLKFPLPPLPEQEAIAEALSDADAWIESLEQLIAKKRLIKQGAMQELLTPPSPSSGNADGEALEPWEVKKLGDYVKFQTGFPFSSDFFNTQMIGERLIKNRDLRSDDSIFYYSGEFKKEFIVNNGDLLIGMDGDFEPVLWKKGKALLNQRVGRVLKLKDISIEYLAYSLIDKLKEIEESTGSTTVKHLSHSDIENLEYKIPSLSDQERIATILSDMDAELEALEQKLSKARQIKQGMMQELLTGRVRLCAPMNKQPQDVVP